MAMEDVEGTSGIRGQGAAGPIRVLKHPFALMSSHQLNQQGVQVCAHTPPAHQQRTRLALVFLENPFEGGLNPWSSPQPVGVDISDLMLEVVCQLRFELRPLNPPLGGTEDQPIQGARVHGRVPSPMDLIGLRQVNIALV